MSKATSDDNGCQRITAIPMRWKGLREPFYTERNSQANSEMMNSRMMIVIPIAAVIPVWHL